MKFFGIIFWWLAFVASGAGSIRQRYGVFDTRRIVGITAFMPAAAYSTAALSLIHI